MMVLILALVCGISAVVGVRRIIGSSGAAQAVETIPVVVASQALLPGEPVAKTSLKIRDFPKGSVPAGVLTEIEQAADRVAFVPIAPDDLVLDSKLAAKGLGPGIATLVPIGMRAVSIPIVNVAAGHSGLIMPKNRVDVLFTSSSLGPNDQTGGGSTTTLLQNVEILAVDRRIYVASDTKAETSEIRAVTLVVTPRQANILDLATNKGTLHLALRNPKDEETAESEPAILAELLFHQEKALSTPSPAAVPVIPIQEEVQEPARIRVVRGRLPGMISVPYR